MFSQPIDDRRAALERDLALARAAARKVMFRVLATRLDVTDLELIRRDSHDMEAAAGRVNALVSLLLSLRSPK